MVCSLRAFPSREKDCRASHENGNRELPARAGGDSPMGTPSSEGDTRGDSDDDFCARHTAGTCGSAETLVGEPLHGAEGRTYTCRDSRPADGAFQVYAGL